MALSISYETFVRVHFWLLIYWVLHFNMFLPVSKSKLWFKMSKEKKKEVRNKTLTDSLEISECNGVRHKKYFLQTQLKKCGRWVYTN